MKRTLFLISASVLITHAHSQSINADLLNAYTDLSNLTNTSINKHLIPNTNNTKDLGSAAKGWRNIYFTGKLSVGGHPFLKNSSPLERGSTYFGYESGLFSVDTAISNTAFGYRSMYANHNGWFNTALGSEAFYNNKSGSNNIAIGYAALYYSNGERNNAIGSGALYLNLTGNNNEAMGGVALYSNLTGSNNVAIGHESMYYNETGNSNVAIGIDALASSHNNSNNVAIGDSTLQFYNDQGNNGAVVAVGSKALSKNTTGFRNTAVGPYALQTVTKGFGNTALGYGADVNAYNRVNATAIGNGAIATADNQVVLGNTSVTALFVGGTLVWPSDGRLKKNIREDVPGLAFINLLRPVTYNYDVHGWNKLIGAKEEKSNNLSNVDDAIASKEKIRYTGFVAQEVEQVADKVKYDFSGVYKPQNDKDIYGLSYADFVVPLVKAVQELSVKNDTLQKQNDALKSRVDKIEKLLSLQNNGTVSSAKESSQTIELGIAAKLEQNIPNPFTSATTIHYYLPVNNSNAYINFYNASGALLKSEKLQGTGYGNISVKPKDLPTGTYQYSLVIGNRIVDTKKMVQVK